MRRNSGEVKPEDSSEPRELPSPALSAITGAAGGSMGAIKLGFIGPGIAARDLHWPALKDLRDEFEVTAVCGHGEKSAREFAALVGGVPFTTDLNELLARPDVEAVVIAAPFELNLPLTRAALRAGKHVLVEKPLAPSKREARAMRDLEASTKLVTMVAENWRYRRIFVRMRELIAEGAVGKPFAAFLDCMGKFSAESKYFSVSTWRLRMPFAPMFMYDVGVHLMSAMRMLLGEVEYGIAQATSLTPGLDKIDSLSFQMKFGSGAHGLLNYYINSQGHDRQNLVILGTEGSLHAEENFSRLTIRKEGGETLVDVAEKDIGYTGEFLDFYRCIREGKRSDSPFAESYGDVRAIAHALASTGKWRGLRVRP
jgi:predicted dehydrogenase